MNKALSRSLAFLALTSVLVIPYFNCGAPTDKGLFGSGGDSECIDPTKPESCNGDVNALFLVSNQMQLQYPISQSNGRFNFLIPCSDGGFPKVTVGFKVKTSNGAALTQGEAQCNAGQAAVFGQITLADVAAWGSFIYQFEFQILAYASTTAQFPIQFDPTKFYPGLQPVLRNAYKAQ